MTAPYRRSVPTNDIVPWVTVGWAVVCPDFDQPDYTVIRWTGTGEPREPHGGPQG